MTEKNTKTGNTSQNLITALSIIVALAAVAYAAMMHMEREAPVEIHQSSVAMTSSSEATENNPVVMTIEGRNVTRSEVLNNFIQSGSRLPPNAELANVFPLLQEQYLVGEVIINAAKEKGLNDQHPAIQDRLRQAYQGALRAVYLEQIGEDLVSEEDIRQAYYDIVVNAPEAMERRARHILLPSQKAANALIIRLEQGADFAKLAEEKSTGPTAANGGNLGFFTREQMVPEFSEAAFALEIGEFTKKPVQTQFGWHIIKVEEERVQPKPEFEQVKEQLAVQLRQAATQQEIQSLRENADVTLFTLEGDVVDVAPASGEDMSTETMEAEAAVPTPAEEDSAETPAEAE